jgi:hypothetical protein
LYFRLVIDIEIEFFRFLQRHFIPVAIWIIGVYRIMIVFGKVKFLVNITAPENRLAFESLLVSGYFRKRDSPYSVVRRVKEVLDYERRIRHFKSYGNFTVYRRFQLDFINFYHLCQFIARVGSDNFLHGNKKNRTPGG